MGMKGIVVTTENKWYSKDFKSPLYKSVGKAVGGFIEVVRPAGLFNPYLMIVNDDGYHLKLPKNFFGSKVYGTELHGHPIRGDIVILKDGFTNGVPDIVGLTNEDLLLFKGLLDDFFGIVEEHENEQKV